MMESRGEAAQAEQVKEAEEQVKEAEEDTETAPHDSNGKSPLVTKKGGGILGALFGWRGAAANVKGTHVLQVQVVHLLQPTKNKYYTSRR
jgi:hypothetical protein